MDAGHRVKRENLFVQDMFLVLSTQHWVEQAVDDKENMKPAVNERRNKYLVEDSTNLVLSCQSKNSVQSTRPSSFSSCDLEGLDESFRKIVGIVPDP